MSYAKALFTELIVKCSSPLLNLKLENEMFIIKPLVPRFSAVARTPKSFKFNTVQMKRKALAPHQDRASFINMLLDQGKSYGQAVREFDSKAKQRV